MDINPLIIDLKKYEEELLDSIETAIHYNELEKSNEYVAHDIAGIKGEEHSNQPFQQVANLYKLPIEEVVKNIREFTMKEINRHFWFLIKVKDFKFESDAN